MTYKYGVVENRSLYETFTDKPSVFKSKKEALTMVNKLKKNYPGQAYSIVRFPSEN
jgi:hypothetical protein